MILSLLAGHIVKDATKFDMFEIIVGSQEAKGNWLTVKRALNLIIEDTDTAK